MRRMNDTGGAGVAPPDVQSPDVQSLEHRIRALAELTIGELKQAWTEAWNAPPPKGARRRLLMLGIAWKWQAEVHGGFAKPLERRLATLEAAFRQGGAPSREGPGASRPPRLQPGARLIRIWKGERHEVQAHADRLSLARPRLALALGHRPRDHRQPPQRPGLLRSARRGCAVTRGAAGPQAGPLRDLHPQEHRGGAGAGVQLARRAARGLHRLCPQPEARGLDRPAPPL